MFWHTHILDTRSYYNYCANKFGKLVHHNPADSLNQEARKFRFGSTLIKYKEKFGNPINFEIWNRPNSDKANLDKANLDKTNLDKANSESLSNINLSSMDLKSRPQLKLPGYKEHLVTDPNIIKIFIFHTFDNGYSIPNELEKITYKKWRPNVLNVIN